MFPRTLSPSTFIFRASGSVKSRIGERGERGRDKGGGKYGARCCDDDGDNGVGGRRNRKRKREEGEISIIRKFAGRLKGGILMLRLLTD